MTMRARLARLFARATTVIDADAASSGPTLAGDTNAPADDGLGDAVLLDELEAIRARFVRLQQVFLELGQPVLGDAADAVADEVRERDIIRELHRRGVAIPA